jgi:hypothetical protein
MRLVVVARGEQQSLNAVHQSYTCICDIIIELVFGEYHPASRIWPTVWLHNIAQYAS